MTAAGETRKQHMPAPGRHGELLGRRRESDERRVGEGFGKVMRVELVGCKQEGEHHLETEEAGQKQNRTGELEGGGEGAENTFRGRDPEGDNQGPGGPARAEGTPG